MQRKPVEVTLIIIATSEEQESKSAIYTNSHQYSLLAVPCLHTERRRPTYYTYTFGNVGTCAACAHLAMYTCITHSYTFLGRTCALHLHTGGRGGGGANLRIVHSCRLLTFCKPNRVNLRTDILHKHIGM